MKVAIIMAYYDRQEQLNRTLLSMKSKYDFQVVIADDASPNDIVLPTLNFPVHIVKIKKEDKIWTNPEPTYNIAILYALKNLSPDIVIIQSPESMHIGDVIDYAVENTTDSNYISFGCFSQGQNKEFNLQEALTTNRAASYNGDNAWYNHPSYRPCGYEFCSSINTKNLIAINGYDERLSFGFSYGDDFLLNRILKLGLKLIITSSPFVVHQWHVNSQDIPEKWTLVHRNKVLYDRLSKSKEYRAHHLITDDFESIAH